MRVAAVSTGLQLHGSGRLRPAKLGGTSDGLELGGRRAGASGASTREREPAQRMLNAAVRGWLALGSVGDRRPMASYARAHPVTAGAAVRPNSMNARLRRASRVRHARIWSMASPARVRLATLARFVSRTAMN